MCRTNNEKGAKGMQVKLNREQCAALAAHLDPEFDNGGEPQEYPVVMRVVYGTSAQPWQLTVGGCYLHKDGEWATYPEGQKA